MGDDFLSVDHSVSGLIVQLVVSAPGPVRVAWGDGASESVGASSSTPHTYAKDGAYRVNVVGPAGLSQTFSVTLGTPLPGSVYDKERERREAIQEQLAGQGATTGRIG